MISDTRKQSNIRYSCKVEDSSLSLETYAVISVLDVHRIKEEEQCCQSESEQWSDFYTQMSNEANEKKKNKKKTEKDMVIMILIQSHLTNQQ